MSHSILIYNNTEKNYVLIKSGFRKELDEAVEDEIYEILSKELGVIDNIFDYIKPKNYRLSNDDWNSNRKVYITKDKFNKYTVKRLIKNVGTFYNSYNLVKLYSIYLLKNNNYVETSKCVSPFIVPEKFSEVLDKLNTCFKENKQGEKLTKFLKNKRQEEGPYLKLVKKIIRGESRLVIESQL